MGRNNLEAIRKDMENHPLPADYSLADDEYHGEESRGALFAANPEASIWKGAVAGAAAGLAAGFVMVKFQELWSKMAEGENKEQDIPDHRAQNAESKVDEESADATVKAANRVTKKFANYELSKSDAEFAGPAVHYAFSAAMGALYGVLGEIAPFTRTAFGNAFGAALFVGADEIAVPALGLSDTPDKVPLSKHLYGLVSHLVYGSATEAGYRSIRKALDKI